MSTDSKIPVNDVLDPELNKAGTGKDITETETEDDFRSAPGTPPKFALKIFFNSSTGAPIDFMVDLSEPEKEQIKKIIEKNGGKVVDTAASAILISRAYYPDRTSVKPEFIYDSVKQQSFLAIEPYKNINETVDETNATATAIAAVNSSANQQGDAVLYKTFNKNGFTADEDAFILEEVRKNPKRRATHRLFHQISEKLHRHTGNSVRYRFRNHLQKKLDYVYKTDEEGRLITDEQGRYIATAIMPGTVKNKFSAEDDYVLCKTIRDKSTVNYSDDNDKRVILPNKFFESLEKEQPHHSRAAWRDRFRKFAKHYGVLNYIQYYENCITIGKTPEPMKNYTARSRTGDKKVKRTLRDAVNGATGPVAPGLENELTFGEFNTAVNIINSLQNDKKVATSGKKELDTDNLFLSDEVAVDSSSMLNTNLSQIPLINKSSSSAIVEILDPDTLSKLFTKEFYSYSSSKILNKINEIVTRDYSTSGADLLLESLSKEAGINKSFGTEILTNCCGDLSLVWEYVNLVLNTGKNPPEHVPGIWTREDDARLERMDISKEDKNYLLTKHGEERIELRRQFISSI